LGKEVLDKYWRAPIRKVLLKLLKWTEKEPSNNGFSRSGSLNALAREIYIPAPLVSVLSGGAFFIVLLFQIGFSMPKVLGLVVFLSMIYIFLALYMKAEQKNIYENPEAIMLIGFLFISSVFLMKLFDKWPLAMPMAAFSVAIALLLSKRLAIITSLILCLTFGILNDFSLEIFFIHLAGSLTSVAALVSVRTRADLVKTGLWIVLANITAIFAIYLFHLWPLPMLEEALIQGVLSGVISALMVLAFLPYLENFFSRTTNLKLLELADFKQPLLKKLSLEAPGTYHHSLIMASMAEQAAEAIDENSLLARVGAYYHDVGKLFNPEYFVENVKVSGNPHDPLIPTMSGLVVISHVKEGVALAQAHKLDRIIIDLIEQHHGTSLIHYFYHKALAAILMLADSCEAASRTIDEPSPGRIRDLVEKIINNKFTDAQFSECPITLADLSKIAESLISSLSGFYHSRIEYQKKTQN
jgi:putative nucleotidyltransferase with HDIG domain